MSDRSLPEMVTLLIEVMAPVRNTPASEAPCPVNPFWPLLFETFPVIDASEA